MLARWRELSEWGTNIYFSSLMFSTCATDFAEKEELLEVVMLLSPVPPNKIQ